MKKITISAIIFSMLTATAFFAACGNPAGPASAPAVITPAVITSVALYIREPAFDQQRATSAQTTGNYRVTGVSWLPNDNPFEPFTSYTVTITVEADDNFVFNDSTTATINGNPVTFYRIGNTATVSFEFPQTGNTPITLIPSINITGLTAPVTEAPQVTTFSYDIGASFTAGTLTWSPNHDPFLGGQIYTATIRFTADQNHQFVEGAVITPNAGTVQRVTNTGNVLTVTLTFPRTIPRYSTVPDLAAFTAAVESPRSIIQGIDTGVTNVRSITINGSNAHFGAERLEYFIASVEVNFEFTGTNRDAAVRAAVGSLVRNAGFSAFNDDSVIVTSTAVYVMPMSEAIFISAVRAFLGTILPTPHATDTVVLDTFNTTNVAISGTLYTSPGVSVDIHSKRDQVHNHVVALLNETDGANVGNPVNPYVNFPGTVTTTGMNANQRPLIVQFPPPPATGFRQPTQADMDAFSAVNVPNVVGTLGSNVSRYVPNRTGLLTPNSNILNNVLRATTAGAATNLSANPPILRQADTIEVNFNRFLRPEYIGDIVVLQDGNRRVFMIRVGVGNLSARPMVEEPPTGANLLNQAAWANNGERALRLGWRPTATGITAAQRNMIIYPTGVARVEPANIARQNAYIRIYTLFTNDAGNEFAGTRVTDFDINGNVTFDLLQRANGVSSTTLTQSTISAARVSTNQSATTHDFAGSTTQRGDGAPGRGLLLDVLTTYFWPRSTTPTAQ